MAVPVREPPCREAAAIEGVDTPSPDAVCIRASRRRWIVDGLVVLAAGIAAVFCLDGWDIALATAWAVAVVIIVRSDLDRLIIPDAASAAIAVLGLVDRGAAAWPDGASAAVEAVVAAVAGGAAAFGVAWAVSFLYRSRYGIDGLGFGDVKLAGASAIWLTTLQQVMALEIACLAALASVVLSLRGRRLRGQTAVPFGAFLAPSAWFVFVAGPAIGTLLGSAP